MEKKDFLSGVFWGSLIIALWSAIISVFLFLGSFINQAVFFWTAICSLGCLLFWAFTYHWEDKEDRVPRTFYWGSGIESLVFMISSSAFVYLNYWPVINIGFWGIILALGALDVMVILVGVKLKKMYLKYEDKLEAARPKIEPN